MSTILKDKFIKWKSQTEENTIPLSQDSIKCSKCKRAFLDLIWDEYGMYYKCSHCGWDSAGLYKTRNKYINGQ